MFVKHFRRNVFAVDNMKSSGLYGYIYDFNVDYRAITAGEIPDIHKYLMEKNNIIKNVWTYEKMFFTAMAFFSWKILNANAFRMGFN